MSIRKKYIPRYRDLQFSTKLTQIDHWQKDKTQKYKIYRKKHKRKSLELYFGDDISDVLPNAWSADRKPWIVLKAKTFCSVKNS